MVIQKVTDPFKIVTDPVLLKELARKGIDKDYVEFTQDYAPRSWGKGHSPYAKFYRDLKSGKRFMVVSGLPRVEDTGHKIEAGWFYAKGKYYSKANLFSAIVDGKQVQLTCLSAQPTGTKKNDRVTYKPQLFLDGVEQPCGEATLLPTDPVNENYYDNVLEWDYGICKRRIRLIEGRFRERWLFPTDPQGEVRITHNQIGDYKLKLGKYAISDDEELVPAEVFAEAIYPVEIGASLTFYPDAHVETSSVDGGVRHIDGAGLTWTNLVAAAGTDAYAEGNYIRVIIHSDGIADKFDYLYRAIMLFDTSGLDDAAVITAATLSIYGETKIDTGTWAVDGNIYSSNPASNIDLEAGDFEAGVGKFGSTAFCDTPITYANWTAASYNGFLFNATGLAAISKTGVSKFGFRNANYDVAEELDPGNHAPTWAASVESQLRGKSSEVGTGYKPKLVVTYTTPVEKTSSDSGSGSETLLSRAYVLPEVGTGSEALGSRLLAAVEQGAGAETLLARLLAGAETALGLDAGGLIFTSSDVGSGLDAILALEALLTGADSGSGIDTSFIIKALLSADSGLGTEAVAALLAGIVAGELMVGSDRLVVKIESAPTGGGMRLPPGGKTSIPSRRVNL